jgi:glycosyltransferase involved in cell wall biosynthesis
MANQLLASRKIAAKFWSIHRTGPFDLVQTPSYFAPGYALLHNGKVPVVCRISSYAPLLRAAAGQQRNFSDYLTDWLEIRQVTAAEARFAPSEFIAGYYRRIEGVATDIIRTPLEQGGGTVDDSLYGEFCPAGPYLLFFGTLNRVKGADLLADVLPAILQKYEHLAVVFIGRDDGMAGGGKLFAHLQEQCKEYAARLHYFPPMAKSRLNPFIANAEAVLFPSRVDNYPNACLEALMLGKTVIGASDSSLEEIISNGVNGFLFQNGDTQSLRTCIEKCLNQSGEEKEKLHQGILAAIEQIKGEDRIGQLLCYYDQVLAAFANKQGNRVSPPAGSG